MGRQGRTGALVAVLAAIALPSTAMAATAPPDGPHCDPLDPKVCLLPWPNDRFTVADPSTPTGRRVALQLDAMPRNRAGLPILPDDQNRADGFSPGQAILTKVPGLETQHAFDNSGLVPITDMARASDRDQAVVVIDADTGERQLVWAELDANPPEPADRVLIVRPGRNWLEGHRYIVALRHLRDAQGDPIPAQAPFRRYRDRIATADPAFEARRPHMEALFKQLARSGVQRKELYLAWDFTVASRESLTGRMLQIRDASFDELGDGDLSDLTVAGDAPRFLVTGTTDFAPCGDDGCQDGEDDRIARTVEGQVAGPCWLDQPGCPPGSRFRLDATGRVQRIPGNTALIPFECIVPRRALDGSDPQPPRVSLYGHGLLGSLSEVEGANVKAMAQEHGFVFCATDWSGMSQYDIPNVATILTDLGRFPTLADRAQQGFLNFLLLGRALIHPQGLGTDPAFPALDTRRLFYDGNSQGGIMGGSLTAVAPDFDRAVLGVPGMNYSTLLQRSSDFPQYGEVLYQAYPDESERQLLFGLIQMLWDRGEADGYAQHMTTSPLPDTPRHTVLMHEAFGDHQVANVAAEVQARTIGASVRQPFLDAGRSADVTPAFGIPAIGSFPFGGSALVIWDTGPIRDGGGTATPPTTNQPPTEGTDPHSAPRNDVKARAQKSAFLRIGGSVVDTCGPSPCYAGGWTGP